MCLRVKEKKVAEQDFVVYKIQVMYPSTDQTYVSPAQHDVPLYNKEAKADYLLTTNINYDIDIGFLFDGFFHFYTDLKYALGELELSKAHFARIIKCIVKKGREYYVSNNMQGACEYLMQTDEVIYQRQDNRCVLNKVDEYIGRELCV
jgi:hypothetical protein